MITPISAHTSTLLTSLTEGKNQNEYLQKPAIRYPKTKGCLVFKYQNGNTGGHGINPRSLIRGSKCVVVSAIITAALIIYCCSYSSFSL
jgi:hypothetical protein